MNVLMVGTGEYTTGFVHDQASMSDKRIGVVALTLFDLRRKGILSGLKMAGTNGHKFPDIRRHLQQAVADVYTNLDVSVDTFPDDRTCDPQAYRRALQELNAGDVVTVFTPDDTHFEIALAAIERGCHVLVAKPLVQLLYDQHGHITGLAPDGRDRSGN